MRPTLPLLASLLLAGVAHAQPAHRWSVAGNVPDFTTALDSAVAHGGRASVRVATENDPAGFGGPMTVLDPAPYAGRYLRVSAYLRTASLGGNGAALWARADTAPPTAPNATGAFATTQGRRVIAGTSDWTPVSIELDVPVNARRATRLADAALLWMLPQHFYPYFDVVRTDWTGALRTALAEAATADETRFDATIERQLAALHDGHGNVFRTSAMRALLPLRLGWVEGRVVVTAVGDSGAAGVRRGDELLAIDGTPALDALRDAEARTSGATPQWIRTVALSRMTVGAPGSTATLRLRDPAAPGAEIREARVARVARPQPPPPLPEKVSELRPGVMYVDLGRVTDDDVTAALPRLQQATGIVFDMRGYPRSSTPRVLVLLTDSVIHSPRFEVPVVTRPDREGVLFDGSGRWAIAPQQPRLRAKVAFLTGGGAISYAESTMGIVEDNRLGPIVGEPTAGTNGNVDPFSLPGGYVVTWTGMRVRKGDGSPHHGVGIRPTVPVSPTLRGVRDGRDEVLERAVALLGGSAL